MKGENIELIIENVWNRQTLAGKSRENFLVLRLFDTRHNLSFHKGNLILNMRKGGLFELKTFIYRVVSFYLGFGLNGWRRVEHGGQEGQGAGNQGEHGAGEGSI